LTATFSIVAELDIGLPSANRLTRALRWRTLRYSSFDGSENARRMKALAENERFVA
jgi:hypothetical protein